MRQHVQYNPEPDPTLVVPFGVKGGGVLTSHPIGLVIVLGLLLMGLVGLPEARPFFIGSICLGGIFGFVLWLRHR
ncbi:MAG: hypothetical protein ACYDCG_09830 [Candidatus Acidiferrales bacterium]